MNSVKWQEISLNKPEAPGKRLAGFERRIKGIGKFGTAENYSQHESEDFRRLLHFYYRATNEKEADALLVKAGALTKLPKRESFLSIGCGDGILGSKIVTEFSDKAVFLDFDKRATRFIRTFMHRKLGPGGPKQEIIHGSLESIKEEKFDLVLPEHILYYQPRKEWLPLLARAFNFVSPGGAMAVIVHGDEGKVADMVLSLGGKPDDIDGLARSCANEFGEGKTHFYKAETWHYARSEFGMSKLAEFFLMDTGADTAGINNYVKGLKKSAHFEISKYDKAIIVWK